MRASVRLSSVRSTRPFRSKVRFRIRTPGRILEIAVFDTLGLENSIARSRALAYLAQTSLRALEVGELEERLASVEAAITSTRHEPGSVFDRPAQLPDYELIGEN